MIAGERDPAQLAKLARGMLRKKHQALLAALTGRFTQHHAFLLGQILAHIDELDQHIAQCDLKVDDYVRPFSREVELLDTIPGVGRRTAEAIVAEVGIDMSHFPSAKIGHYLHPERAGIRGHPRVREGIRNGTSCPVLSRRAARRRAR